VSPSARPGALVDAGAMRTSYEAYGDGESLVLLHGGLCTAETWDAQIPAMAQRFRVLVPERRGHGRTPDVDGPVTFEAMAQDPEETHQLLLESLAAPGG
jgi:pimeloyl-ACP methyl ester carboxylesterase